MSHLISEKFVSENDKMKLLRNLLYYNSVNILKVKTPQNRKTSSVLSAFNRTATS